ncbi:MAG: hypothetical protein HY692_03685 [Cyanobacteria bacterium NC_groundwater_1444_Ag_S-0.65um_54_12]|nr:hypothetical protein [Cyanobacteria bacterium NC_groundwater_1444_Ag_S-0.65um_54_12]
MIEAAQRASIASNGPALSLTELLASAGSGENCPYCKFSLKDSIVRCSICGNRHHEGCWKANFGCTTKDCKGKPTKPALAREGEQPEVPYRVVLTSLGSTDEAQAAASAQIAKLFNVPLEQLRAALRQIPAVAKHGLSRPEAAALAARLEKTGAEARVEAEKS